MIQENGDYYYAYDYWFWIFKEVGESQKDHEQKHSKTLFLKLHSLDIQWKRFSTFCERVDV